MSDKSKSGSGKETVSVANIAPPAKGALSARVAELERALVVTLAKEP
ncbi:MAG: hypothetical protein MSB12_00860 [Lentisphaeraceae bacterium]|nr:hypothetical protein [Lentisphaeraceae bacterium]